MDLNLDSIIAIYKLIVHLDESAFLFIVALIIPLLYGLFAKLFSLDKLLPLGPEAKQEPAETAKDNAVPLAPKVGMGLNLGGIVPNAINAVALKPNLISVVVLSISSILLVVGTIQLYAAERSIEQARQGAQALKNYLITKNYSSISEKDALLQFEYFAKGDVKKKKKYFDLMVKYFSKDFAYITEERDSVVKYRKDTVQILKNGIIRAYDDDKGPDNLIWIKGVAQDSTFIVWQKDSTVKAYSRSIVFLDDTLRARIDSYCLNALKSYLTNSYALGAVVSTQKIFDHDNHFLTEYVFKLVATYPEMFGLVIYDDGCYIKRLK